MGLGKEAGKSSERSLASAKLSWYVVALSDHVEIKALCDAFRWNVKVAYLNGQSKNEVNFVKIPETSYPSFEPVTLLYRYEYSVWISINEA